MKFDVCVLDLVNSLFCSPYKIIKNEKFYDWQNQDASDPDYEYFVPIHFNQEIIYAFFERAYDEKANDYWLNKFFSEKNISVKYVDSYGGAGKGDDYYSIYSFSNGTDTCLIQFDGWYTSYNGAEYQNMFLVEEYKEVVTKYKKS